MNSIKLMVAIALIWSLSGCKRIDLPNGQIPSEFLESLSQVTGTYRGEFNDEFLELHLVLKDNTLSLRPSRDLLSPECESYVGALRAIWVASSKAGSVYFDFNPGNCGRTIDGRELEVALKQRNGQLLINLKILERVYSNPRSIGNSSDPSTFDFVYLRGLLYRE